MADGSSFINNRPLDVGKILGEVEITDPERLGHIDEAVNAVNVWAESNQPPESENLTQKDLERFKTFLQKHDPEQSEIPPQWEPYSKWGKTMADKAMEPDHKDTSVFVFDESIGHKQDATITYLKTKFSSTLGIYAKSAGEYDNGQRRSVLRNDKWTYIMLNSKQLDEITNSKRSPFTLPIRPPDEV